MRARYRGICPLCGRPIRPGMPICIFNRAVHVRCVPDPAAGRARDPEFGPGDDRESLQARLAACERAGFR
jgi:hypothetical protein